MDEGFTLLEVLVVLAIVGTLSGVIGTVIGTAITSAEIEATEERLDNVKEALLLYFEDIDAFPQDTGNAVNDLGRLIIDPGITGWNGPYMSSGFEQNDYALDAWGRTLSYSYTPGGMACTVESSGPDGSSGNSDDISLTIDATSVYRNKVRSVKTELEVIKVAAQAYATDTGGLYPGTIGTLFTGGYLSDESFRRDPWVREYQVSGNQFISYGPDGGPGGGDDIYPD
jgi:general secretion pathway protein G